MVEGGGLENRCTRKGTGGSNPSSSAIFLCITLIFFGLMCCYWFNLRFFIAPYFTLISSFSVSYG